MVWVLRHLVLAEIWAKSLVAKTAKKKRFIAVLISAEDLRTCSLILLAMVLWSQSANSLDHLAVEHVLLSKFRLWLDNGHAAFDSKSMLHFDGLFVLVFGSGMLDTLKTKWRTKILLCNFVAVKTKTLFYLFSFWQSYLTIKMQAASEIILHNLHWNASAIVSLSGSSGQCSSFGVRMLQESRLGLCSQILLSVALFVAQNLVEYCLRNVS